MCWFVIYLISFGLNRYPSAFMIPGWKVLTGIWGQSQPCVRACALGVTRHVQYIKTMTVTAQLCRFDSSSSYNSSSSGSLEFNHWSVSQDGRRHLASSGNHVPFYSVTYFYPSFSIAVHGSTIHLQCKCWSVVNRLMQSKHIWHLLSCTMSSPKWDLSHAK